MINEKKVLTRIEKGKSEILIIREKLGRWNFDIRYSC